MSRPGFLALALALAPALLHAQVANPFEGDPAALRAGSALYANRCAECHGADAKGLGGPDLTALWGLGADDEYVFEAIRRGVPGSIMPSSEAPDQELWAIVAYLRGLGTVSTDYSAGDAGRGRALFAGSCARCHRIGGRGGRLGPDLSRITAVRSREALVRSLRLPGAATARGYRPVTLETRDGERIRGVVKAEDAFSIQIMDTTERLQGFVKAELRELVHEPGSLMPAFGPDRLTDAELDDLFRYLASARETRAEGR